MHQVPLAYMAVFRHASLEPGLCGPEPNILANGLPRPCGSTGKRSEHTLYLGPTFGLIAGLENIRLLIKITEFLLMELKKILWERAGFLCN